MCGVGVEKTTAGYYLSPGLVVGLRHDLTHSSVVDLCYSYTRYRVMYYRAPKSFVAFKASVLRPQQNYESNPTMADVSQLPADTQMPNRVVVVRRGHMGLFCDLTCYASKRSDNRFPFLSFFFWARRCHRHGKGGACMVTSAYSRACWLHCRRSRNSAPDSVSCF